MMKLPIYMLSGRLTFLFLMLRWHYIVDYAVCQFSLTPWHHPEVSVCHCCQYFFLIYFHILFLVKFQIEKCPLQYFLCRHEIHKRVSCYRRRNLLEHCSIHCLLWLCTIPRACFHHPTPNQLQSRSNLTSPRTVRYLYPRITTCSTSLISIDGDQTGAGARSSLTCAWSTLALLEQCAAIGTAWSRPEVIEDAF